MTAASPARLDVTLRDGCATLTICNPDKRNAVDARILLDVESAVADLAARGARVAILRGEGERIFSSGYDIDAITGSGGEDISLEPIARATGALERAPFPVIALVLGGAWGAGCEIVAACDLRIAADDARFAIPAAKLGVVYPPAGIARLARAGGTSLVRELILTARPMPAVRARELGFLSAIHPRADVIPEAERLAKEIAGLAPLSLRTTREVLAALGDDATLSATDLARFNALRETVLSSEDFREGQRAFAEKRTPRFVGR